VLRQDVLLVIPDESI